MNQLPDHQQLISSDRWVERLEEIGVVWRMVPDRDVGSEKLSWALNERVKELNCFYAMSQITERRDMTLEAFLAMLVDLLPPSWQYPGTACARIVLADKTYESRFFDFSDWSISAPIHIHGKISGMVSVYYVTECPSADEGPFLSDERDLIDAVAERIGRVAERKTAELDLADTNRQLTIERTAMRESNAALRAILDRIEVEKTVIQENIKENVDRILTPILNALIEELDSPHRDYALLLQENLEQITTPFIRNLSQQQYNLTPTELRVCDMIRSGMGSKEIASLRKVSLATIHRQREKIRQKLGLTNTKRNLASFLQNEENLPNP